jgi:hypothetical protein
MHYPPGHARNASLILMGDAFDPRGHGARNASLVLMGDALPAWARNASSRQSRVTRVGILSKYFHWDD